MIPGDPETKIIRVSLALQELWQEGILMVLRKPTNKN